MTKEAAVRKVLDLAAGEIGYLEKASRANLYEKTANAGLNNYNKYAEILDGTDILNGKKNGYDWCACFVLCIFFLAFGRDFMLPLLGVPSGSAAAGVKYLMQYMRANGGFYASDPEPGDVIFYRRGDSWKHTGIVWKVEGSKITTIEGNAGTPQGVHSFTYPASWSDIGGYGRPNWKCLESIAEPQEVAPMDFEKEMAAYLAGLQNSAADKWAAEAVDWAVDNKIIAGDGGTGFAWQRPVTRQEAAQILYNFWQRFIKA